MFEKYLFNEHCVNSSFKLLISVNKFKVTGGKCYFDLENTGETWKATVKIEDGSYNFVISNISNKLYMYYIFIFLY